ncbi:hypothetical protein PG999_001789 [Apiospora kogelbergensis]|uniref:C2H2-type domain-containing protein n=1 Tax=Apiospora kogelbergensis TaxID=1337665 RepID=A0AAW0R6K1_9PEZI
MRFFPSHSGGPFPISPRHSTAGKVGVGCWHLPGLRACQINQLSVVTVASKSQLVSSDQLPLPSIASPVGDFDEMTFLGCRILASVISKDMSESEHTGAPFAACHAEDAPSPSQLSHDEHAWSRQGSPGADHGPARLSASSRAVGVYACPECGEKLTRLDSMARHRRSRHRIGRQYYCRHLQCKGKSRSFGRFDNFKRHMESSHGILVSPGSANEEDGDEDGGRESAQRAFPPLPSASTLPAARPKADSHMPVLPVPIIQHSPPRQPKVPTAKNGKPPILGKPNILPDLRSAATDREDLESLDKHELIRRLRSKLMECEQLQHQCHVLSLERDEYAEAFRMSESNRKQRGELG